MTPAIFWKPFDKFFFDRNKDINISEKSHGCVYTICTAQEIQYVPCAGIFGRFENVSRLVFFLQNSTASLYIILGTKIQ